GSAHTGKERLRIEPDDPEVLAGRGARRVGERTSGSAGDGKVGSGGEAHLARLARGRLGGRPATEKHGRCDRPGRAASPRVRRRSAHLPSSSAPAAAPPGPRSAQGRTARTEGRAGPRRGGDGSPRGWPCPGSGFPPSRDILGFIRRLKMAKGSRLVFWICRAVTIRSILNTRGRGRAGPGPP